ncbi:hypothetical protein phiJL1_ORF32 [Lactobacillus phage phiJL-1]|uniref:Uncharacterized protein n=1 Tax=Lactobacillus phage phiJL-1 TaxID=2892345 RepID=Q597W6_9CAUD|nr:hypothetical protein phiJL1_ORF32 [Lactobacillus phage phiJL-1]AAP74505.1 hypothetical protein [Lactobacillus phage phiJL-1]
MACLSRKATNGSSIISVWAKTNSNMADNRGVG